MKPLILAACAFLAVLPAVRAQDKSPVQMGEYVKLPSLDLDQSMIITDAGPFGCKTGALYVKNVRSPIIDKAHPPDDKNNYDSFFFVPDKQKLVSTKTHEFIPVCLIVK